ncbi:MAG TPA: adenylosuccinate lyase [Patescibacteria group bacterium]
MINSFDYSTYLSPFTARYGSTEMRTIWSEVYKRKLWRKIWVGLANAEYKEGLLTKEELNDIVSHKEDIDLVRAKEIEKAIYHELMAEIRTFSEQCKIGGGKIHLGATSTDILDNTTIIQIHESLKITKSRLKNLLSGFSGKIKENKDTICMGYTHLQPAEPTTLSYRFAFYAQDLLLDYEFLEKIEPFLLGKGVKGAVGTSASYTSLLSEEKSVTLESDILRDLGIKSVDISTQTYPRKIDLLVVEALSNIASSLHKFAFDYRIMQQPSIGEWVEKRDKNRIGSSAMPFKRNPDKAEKVCSLSRYVSSLFNSAWSNPALSLLERTLDDSASQRIFLPEAFLAIDECLITTQKLLENLQINMSAVEKNLSIYGQFSAVEPILMYISKKGADRQEMHEILKNACMKVWEEKDRGKNISLLSILQKDTSVTRYIDSKKLKSLLDPKNHIGLAKIRSDKFLKKLSTRLKS